MQSSGLNYEPVRAGLSLIVLSLKDKL